MAKGKIIWSHKARIKLYEIMEFYVQRNGNAVYATKLYRLFTKNTKLLLKHPKLGTKTTLEGETLLTLQPIPYQLIPKQRKQPPTFH